ncbi:hypothetical protein G6L86_12255 [Agrobacterium tumefaciens]|uniref:hypothetical protein n=1 Tax=Agrobacterium tumefaciens TaxID=358 RepID=UPI001572F80A|nr:hypothetical protein [Agrobacterium tumefaciens]NSX86358.1 hypothetical protein [Agrobacterium tumefaciens]
MCGREEIRYVHHMVNEDYEGGLDVGCVCAEKMEDDYVNPRRRERDLKNVAARRKRWLTRKWKTSQSGNPYLKTDASTSLYIRLATAPGAARSPVSGQAMRLRTDVAMRTPTAARDTPNSFDRA